MRWDYCIGHSPAHSIPIYPVHWWPYHNTIAIVLNGNQDVGGHRYAIWVRDIFTFFKCPLFNLVSVHLWGLSVSNSRVRTHLDTWNSRLFKTFLDYLNKKFKTVLTPYVILSAVNTKMFTWLRNASAFPFPAVIRHNNNLLTTIKFKTFQDYFVKFTDFKAWNLVQSNSRLFKTYNAPYEPCNSYNYKALSTTCVNTCWM